MIVRKDAGGGLTLIRQTDHSQFVGQLAAHWGNDQFAPLRPYESVVRAATFHDYGYMQWEPDLPFDAEHGVPYEFRRSPTTQRTLDAYKWVTEWLGGIDPYSGLLVSMHRTGLWRNRYDTIDHPGGMSRQLSPEVASFAEFLEERQKAQQPAFDQQELWTNYHLLQLWDLLGLYFGCQEPYDEYMEPVPLDYQGRRTRITLNPAGPHQVAVDPYPFDARPLRLQIACKRVADRYESESAFRKAFAQAPLELLEYELV
ncbi:MAG TPA: DUF3891 family protein [Chloroflexota bacterium]|nr:DUF3891 family protein [Chloroflexota bacterium]